MISFGTVYWVKIIGAVLSLLMALVYLVRYTAVSLLGFPAIGFTGGIVGYLINTGALAAVGDLCGSKGVFSTEYGHGFRDARLILTCEKCGRAVNKEARSERVKRIAVIRARRMRL